MQERNNNTAVSAAEGRNNGNTTAVTAKKSANVKKNTSGSVSAKRASNMRAVRAPKVVTIKKENKAPFPWAVVVLAAIFTCLFLFMMMNYAEVGKYRNEITSLDNQITSMKKNCDELKVELSNKYDLNDIKAYATEEMGMVSGETLTKEHVTVQQEDKIEIYNYDEGEEDGFGFLLTGFGEIFSDFLN